MADFIIIAVVALAVFLAMRYIIREKKKGVKCIGCPAAGTCANRQMDASGCHCGSGNGESHGCGCGK